MFGWFRKPTNSAPQDVKWAIIEKSLLNEPNQWELDRSYHRLTHKGTGFTFWVGNRDYGLAGGFNKNQAPKSCGAGEAERPSDKWAKRLWVLIEPIKKGGNTDIIEVIEAFEKHLGLRSTFLGEK